MNCLFVGGPKHQQYVDVGDPLPPSYCVTDSFPTVNATRKDPEFFPLTPHVYNRRLIVYPGNHTRTVYTLHSMSDEEINRYFGIKRNPHDSN